MTKEWFDYTYPIFVEKSHNYEDLQLIAMFVHSMISCSKEEAKESLNFARIVEKDLLDRNILPFKVERLEDIERINPFTPVGFIQWCIWSLLSKQQ